MKKVVLTAVSLVSFMVAGSALAGDAAAGKAAFAGKGCVGCHGPAGISVAPAYPNLAGQKEQYVVKQLKDFKSGARKDPTMNAMVAAINDADIDNIAAFLATLK